jgi:hypothetical protein
MEGLPPFTAGAVGYCAYDIVRRLENIGEHAADDLDVPDCMLMFFDRVLAFDHLRHQIHIVASADVTRETPKVAYDARSKTSRASRKNLPRDGSRRTGAKRDEGKAEGKGAHFEGEVSGKRSPSEGVHRRRRHFPGRAFAALGFRAGSLSAGSLSRAAHGESVAVYVFPALRRSREKIREECTCSDRLPKCWCVPGGRSWNTVRSRGRIRGAATKRKTPRWNRKCSATRRNAPNT